MRRVDIDTVRAVTAQALAKDLNRAMRHITDKMKQARNPVRNETAYVRGPQTSLRFILLYTRPKRLISSSMPPFLIKNLKLGRSLQYNRNKSTPQLFHNPRS